MILLYIIDVLNDFDYTLFEFRFLTFVRGQSRFHQFIYHIFVLVYG